MRYSKDERASHTSHKQRSSAQSRHLTPSFSYYNRSDRNTNGYTLSSTPATSPRASIRRPVRRQSGLLTPFHLHPIHPPRLPLQRRQSSTLLRRVEASHLMSSTRLGSYLPTFQLLQITSLQPASRTKVSKKPLSMRLRLLFLYRSKNSMNPGANWPSTAVAWPDELTTTTSGATEAFASRKPERLGSGLRTGLDWTGLDSASANAVPSLASAVLFVKHGLYIILNDYSFARKSQHGRLSL